MRFLCSILLLHIYLIENENAMQSFVPQWFLDMFYVAPSVFPLEYTCNWRNFFHAWIEFVCLDGKIFTGNHNFLFTLPSAALEPFFNAAASQFVLGHQIPFSLWLSLAPVVLGNSITSCLHLHLICLTIFLNNMHLYFVNFSQYAFF